MNRSGEVRRFEVDNLSSPPSYGNRSSFIVVSRMSSELNDAIEGIMDRGFRFGANRLDPTDRTVYVISNADFEICLGSASGYLYNSAGNDIELLATAFEDIGCSLLATRARKLVNAMLAYGCIPSDRQSRWNLIQSDNATINRLIDVRFKIARKTLARCLSNTSPPAE